jgi:hypothetical protein
MKKIIKHYPMTDRLIVRRGYKKTDYSCVTLCHYLSFATWKMANDRFASLTTDELQELLENQDSSNTKKCYRSCKTHISWLLWAKSINPEELIQQSKEEIACFCYLLKVLLFNINYLNMLNVSIHSFLVPYPVYFGMINQLITT